MSFKKFLDMQLTTFNLHYILIEIYTLELDLGWGFDLQNNYQKNAYQMSLLKISDIHTGWSKKKFMM